VNPNNQTVTNSFWKTTPVLAYFPAQIWRKNVTMDVSENQKESWSRDTVNPKIFAAIKFSISEKSQL
jgi:hypothetical protein